MTIRAKFTVTQIIETQFGSAPEHRYKTVILEPRYDPKLCKEDTTFMLATPSGKMEIRIDNPVALEAMPINKVFYVDFIPIE